MFTLFYFVKINYKKDLFILKTTDKDLLFVFLHRKYVL